MENKVPLSLSLSLSFLSGITTEFHSVFSLSGGIDGKFRHFEQDTEYKLQLNLNHGLKFPLTNGSLYGRLHSHQSRGERMSTRDPTSILRSIDG